MSLERAEGAEGVHCVVLAHTGFRHILLPLRNHENRLSLSVSVTIIVLFHDLIVYAIIWEPVSI